MAERTITGCLNIKVQMDGLSAICDDGGKIIVVERSGQRDEDTPLALHLDVGDVLVTVALSTSLARSLAAALIAQAAEYEADFPVAPVGHA